MGHPKGGLLLLTYYTNSKQATFLTGWGTRIFIQDLS